MAEWFLQEIASIFSNLPIALYALGFPVQNGLVSAICDKAAGPAPFIGSVSDFRTIWDIKQTDLFGTFGPGRQFQVASLRHGNSFPLVNKAILSATGCIDKKPSLHSDLTLPRAVNVDITFFTPVRGSQGHNISDMTAALIGGLAGALELSAIVCSAVLQALNRMPLGSALAVCHALSTLSYMLLQQLIKPVYAHGPSTQSDIERTAKAGAATDIHVVVPDWNSDEMYVLVGYSSYLHALTNMPARVIRPLLLRWTCRAIGVALCVQAALLAKLIQAQPPGLYGSPIWLISTLVLLAVRAGLSKVFCRVILPATDRVETVHAPRLIMPSRRAALALISSLPMTPSRVDRWDWMDEFMPNNERRRTWQIEMDIAMLSSPTERKAHLSDDGRRIVSQVRDARFGNELQKLCDHYETRVGLRSVSNQSADG